MGPTPFFHTQVYFPSTVCLKTILSPLKGLGTLVKNHLAIYVRPYSWALCSIQLVYMSACKPVLHCFEYCIFVVSLTRIVGSSSLFFCKIVLAFCWEVVPWNSMWILEWVLVFLQKQHWGFDRDCIDSIDYFG